MSIVARLLGVDEFRDREGKVRKSSAIAGSIAHFVLAPVLVAGLIPYAMTSWRLARLAPIAMIAGSALVAAGTLVLIACFWLFVRDGRGTPAPIAPTEELVVNGPYRFVRNPMYVSVVSVIAGQGLLFGQESVLLYGAIAGGVMAAFAHGYEEPQLRATFGAQYDMYRQNVPAWIPRWTAWRGGAGGPGR